MEASAPKRICIIGVGGISRLYARALRELGQHLVAGCCRTEAKGLAFAEEFGCKWYSCYEDMLDTEQPDVALVCTPSGFHLEPTMAAAQRKIHVLCDKPLEITLERCDQMIAACDEAGVQLGCLFQSRFMPQLQSMFGAAQNGRFGALSILSGYVPWYRDDAYYSPDRWQGTAALDGGGACMNQSIHTIDVLIWLASATMDLPDHVNPVAQVSAFTANRAHSEDLIEVEDTAVACLKFRNGALGQVLGATSMYPGTERLVWLAGRDGTAELRGDDITQWQFREPAEGDAEVVKPKEAGKDGGASDPLAGLKLEAPTECIRSFLLSLDGEVTYGVGGVEARKAVQVILAIYEAALLGKTVTIE